MSRPATEAAGAAPVEAAVLGPAGRSDVRLRRAVLERAACLAGRDAPPPPGEVPETLAPLVEKIVRHAYRVTDEDIAAARAAGHDEDELFDVIVAAALGAGLVRRERGLAAIVAWESAR
jgi:alkylhydroperoxidase family enzyme